MQRMNTNKTIALKRAAGRQWVLKPQDLAVAFKLVCLKDQWLPYSELGKSMCLSQFEAHAAVKRLTAAGLLVDLDGRPRPLIAALRSFVLHGARFAYPPVRGEQTIGFPTGHGAAPLQKVMATSAEAIPVWPHPQGKVRGQALLPLYEKLPLAAIEDPALYELLALFDALRAGQARERALATKGLEERLK